MDSFNWFVIQDVWKNLQFVTKSSNTQTLSPVPQEGYESFRLLQIPIGYLKQSEQCDIPFFYWTNIAMKKTINAFVQVYSNVCETFDIIWNETYHQDDLITYMAYSNDIQTDIDLSDLVQLNQFDSSVGTGEDQTCKNIQFELESRNDDSNQFSECSQTNFYGESSSQELCHSSQVQFKIQDKNILQIMSSGNIESFQMYLWAYVVDINDNTKILNKRAAKLQVNIIKPINVHNVDIVDIANETSNYACGFNITNKKELIILINMTLETSNSYQFTLQDYINLAFNCTESNYEINFSLQQTGYSDHLQFDYSTQSIIMQITQDNVNELSGLNQIVTIMVELSDTSTNSILQTESIIFFFVYSEVEQQIQQVDQSTEQQDGENADSTSIIESMTNSEHIVLSDTNQQIKNEAILAQIDRFFRSFIQRKRSSNNNKSEEKTNNKQQDQQFNVQLQQVTPTGIVNITFGGHNSDINGYSFQKDKDSMILVIYSRVEDVIIVGQAVNETLNINERRKLQDNQFAQKTKSKNFMWFPYSNETKYDKLSLQLSFDYPEIISKGEYDQLYVLFKETYKIQPLNATIPPQMSSEQFERVTVEGNTISNGMTSSIILMIMLQIFLGGLLSWLFGMIQTLQKFTLILMLDFKYNAELMVLIKYCIMASEVDIFQSSLIYETIFNFRQTQPFNPTFELFEINNMNYMFNSQSLPIIFVIILLQAVLQRITDQFTRKYFYVRICRKCGQQNQQRNKISTKINTFIAQSFQPLVFSTSLMTYAIFKSNESNDLSIWFDTRDNILCSILTLITIMALIYHIAYVTWLLRNNKMRNKEDHQIDVFYEGINFYKRNIHAILIYLVFEFLLKIIKPIVLIYLDGYSSFQAQIFSFSLFFSACLLAHIHPYTIKSQNIFQIFNQACLYLVTLIQTVYLLESEDKSMIDSLRNKLDKSIKYLIVCNLSINILLIGIYASQYILKSILKIKRKNKMNKSIRQKFNQRNLMLKCFSPQYLKDQSNIENELNHIKLMKQYLTQRSWCIEQKLNVSHLQDEKELQKFLKNQRYRLFIQSIRQRQIIKLQQQKQNENAEQEDQKQMNAQNSLVQINSQRVLKTESNKQAKLNPEIKNNVQKEHSLSKQYGNLSDEQLGQRHANLRNRTYRKFRGVTQKKRKIIKKVNYYQNQVNDIGLSRIEEETFEESVENKTEQDIQSSPMQKDTSQYLNNIDKPILTDITYDQQTNQTNLRQIKTSQNTIDKSNQDNQGMINPNIEEVIEILKQQKFDMDSLKGTPIHYHLIEINDKDISQKRHHALAKKIVDIIKKTDEEVMLHLVSTLCKAAKCQNLFENLDRHSINEFEGQQMRNKLGRQLDQSSRKEINESNNSSSTSITTQFLSSKEKLNRENRLSKLSSSYQNIQQTELYQVTKNQLQERCDDDHLIEICKKSLKM